MPEVELCYPIAAHDTAPCLSPSCFQYLSHIISVCLAACHTGLPSRSLPVVEDASSGAVCTHIMHAVHKRLQSAAEWEWFAPNRSKPHGHCDNPLSRLLFCQCRRMDLAIHLRFWQQLYVNLELSETVCSTLNQTAADKSTYLPTPAGRDQHTRCFST